MRGILERHSGITGSCKEAFTVKAKKAYLVNAKNLKLIFIIKFTSRMFHNIENIDGTLLSLRL